MDNFWALVALMYLGGAGGYAALQFVDRGLRCTGVERPLNQSIGTATADANNAKSADECQTMQ